MIVEYDSARRAEVADLTERVWGTRPAEAELEWFFERNPVRPASVLLAEEDGRAVGMVAISFVRMSIGGEEQVVGMPMRLATDPGYRGRGLFQELEAANEERARAAGVRLLLIVPNAASAPILTGRLGWQTLPAVRVWARPRTVRSGRSELERFSEPVDEPGAGDRVLRDAVWLNWRFADAPMPYELLTNGGYAAVGRRERIGVIAAATPTLLGAATRLARQPVVIAAPPPSQHSRYLRAGFVPTPRKLTVLGRSLDPAQPLPERPHFELGDLDFF